MGSLGARPCRPLYITTHVFPRVRDLKERVRDLKERERDLKERETQRHRQRTHIRVRK